MRPVLLVISLVGCTSGGPPGDGPPTDVPAERCTGGADEDGDARADCDDHDCASTCDADGDGEIALSLGGLDCDDADPAVHPGAPELCDEARSCDAYSRNERVDVAAAAREFFAAATAVLKPTTT